MPAKLSKKEQRIVLILSLLAFLIRVPLAFRSIRALAGYPYADDAFYVFSIAKHLALGQGASVDGIHLTNGFQPLIVLLYTPIFWLCGVDSWLAIRWTLLLGGLIAALFIWSIALLVRSVERTPAPGTFSTPVVAAAIWALTYPCFLQLANGLETGLASLFIVLALIVYANGFVAEPPAGTNGTQKAKSYPKPWLLGIVLGFAVLARIDAAIFVAVIVFIMLARKQFREALIVGGIAFLLSLPWWLFNWVYFGNLMPESGQAENIWPMPPYENIYRAVQSISGILTLVIYLPDSISFPLHSLWLVILIAGISLFGIKMKLLRSVRAQLRGSVLLPLLLFSVALIIYYTFFFRAPHFLPRFFQPARILWSIFFAAGASALWKQQKMRGIIAFAAVSAVAFFVGRNVQNAYWMHNNLYEVGMWARAHPQEKIGMLQSGVAGFIAPNVINLDGKVNDAALRAHQHGRLADYIRAEDFTYLADEKPLVEDLAKIARTDELFFDSVGMIDRIQLMERRDLLQVSN